MICAAMGRWAAWALLMILPAGGAIAAALERTDVFVAGQGGYHTYRIPALMVARNETVLAFCEGRKNNSSDTGDVDLLLRRSADGGRTWSEPQVVWDDGPNTCGNPCPVLDQQTGTIWLLLTHNPGDTDERQIRDRKPGATRTVWLSRSEDHGQTWRAPANIGVSTKDPSWGWYATGPGVGIQIERGRHRGRLVIPCDHSFYGAGDKEDGEFAGHGSHIIYSDDHGQSWRLGGTVRPQMNESQVVELAEEQGGLLINMRTTTKTNRRGQAFSRDGGLTWTAPEPAPELVEPRCQASLLRYNWPSGNEPGRILFSNPASTRRKSLTVRVSCDDGKTWPVSRVLHEGPSAYSCLTVLPDKAIGCLYECGRTNAYEKISFARFPLGWLEGPVLQLGTQRELFVDHYLIAKMEGAQLRLHEPRREGIALKFDRPWEGGFSCYTTVIKDGGTYRMYYRGLPSATRNPRTGSSGRNRTWDCLRYTARGTTT
jgi:sialidase-1